LTAILANGRKHVGDRVLGDVDPRRLHAAIAKRFDEEPEGAPRIENAPRLDVRDDAIGDSPEEPEPGAIATTAATATVPVVVLVELRCLIRDWRRHVLSA
jgi:hypothetical protein